MTNKENDCEPQGRPPHPEFDRWQDLSLSRYRFVMVLLLISLALTLSKTIAEKRLLPTGEVAYILFFLPLTMFDRLRNNRLVWTLMLVGLYIFHLVVCVSLIQFFHNETPMLHGFELKQGSEIPTLLPSLLRVVSIPAIFVMWTVRVGFPPTQVICASVVLAMASAAVVVTVTNTVFGDDVRPQMSAAMWCFIPLFLTCALVYENDTHFMQAKTNAYMVKIAGETQLKNQQQAASNQQRIMGYIFHEVRNPINNIMLATELALDLLSPSPTRQPPPPPPPPLPLTHSYSSSSSSSLAPPTTTTIQQEMSILLKEQCTTTTSSTNNQNDSNSSNNNTSESFTLSKEGLNEVREMVEDIHQSTKAAVRVLNDALNLQKLQSGAFEFVHKPFLLDDLVTFTLRMVQPQMRRKRIQLSQSLSRRLQGVAVEGDFHRLQQVLTNYLNNAYKFTPAEGTVQVRVKQVKTMSLSNQKNTAFSSSCHQNSSSSSNNTNTRDEFFHAGKQGETTTQQQHHHHHHQQQQQQQQQQRKYIFVRTSVFNTGDGIKEEDRPKIFQPWSQIRSGDLQQDQGSGLGLALCKGFVEKGHGGQVGFSSVVGEGTCFHFTIPFALAPMPSANPNRSSSANTNVDDEQLHHHHDHDHDHDRSHTRKKQKIEVVSEENNNNNDNNNDDNNDNNDDNNHVESTDCDSTVEDGNSLPQSRVDDQDGNSCSGGDRDNHKTHQHNDDHVLSEGTSRRLSEASCASSTNASLSSTSTSTGSGFVLKQSSPPSPSFPSSYSRSPPPPPDSPCHEPLLVLTLNDQSQPPPTPPPTPPQQQAQDQASGPVSSSHSHSSSTHNSKDKRHNNTPHIDTINDNNSDNNTQHLLPHPLLRLHDPYANTNNGDTNIGNNSDRPRSGSRSKLKKRASNEISSRRSFSIPEVTIVASAASNENRGSNSGGSSGVLFGGNSKSRIMNGEGKTQVSVVVVEDSALCRKLLAKTLSAIGVTYVQCENGQEAVNLITQCGTSYCSIILMDKEMPLMDGFEATLRIRALGFTGPIVGCTGNAMDDQIAEFLQVGASHVLGKPITQTLLRSTLEHFGIIQHSLHPSDQ